MLLTSSLFPGLEIVGVALSQLSGGSIDGAGVFTVAIVRRIPRGAVLKLTTPVPASRSASLSAGKSVSIFAISGHASDAAQSDLMVANGDRRGNRITPRAPPRRRRSARRR